MGTIKDKRDGGPSNELHTESHIHRSSIQQQGQTFHASSSRVAYIEWRSSVAPGAEHYNDQDTKSSADEYHYSTKHALHRAHTVSGEARWQYRTHNAELLASTKPATPRSTAHALCIATRARAPPDHTARGEERGKDRARYRNADADRTPKPLPQHSRRRKGP